MYPKQQVDAWFGKANATPAPRDADRPAAQVETLRLLSSPVITAGESVAVMLRIFSLGTDKLVAGHARLRQTIAEREGPHAGLVGPNDSF